MHGANGMANAGPVMGRMGNPETVDTCQGTHQFPAPVPGRANGHRGVPPPRRRVGGPWDPAPYFAAHRSRAGRSPIRA
jgi:hypothetical protein